MSIKYKFFIGLIFILPALVSAEVSWYGQINRGMLLVDDGHEKSTFFVDSGYDNSLVGITGQTNMDNQLEVGGQLELISTVASGSGDKAVNQLNRSGTGEIEISIVDTWLQGDFGKLSLGYGKMASKSSGTATLADADLISNAGPGDMAGGMYFHENGSAGRVVETNPQIDSIFGPISGLGIANRIRYDLPKFADVIVSTSVGGKSETEQGVVTKNKYCADLALNYKKTMAAFQVKGVVAVARFSKDSDVHFTKKYNGSFAVLHINTGLNAAFSLGMQTKPNDTNTDGDNTKKKRNFYYIQLGKQANLVKYGKTNFAVDYWQAKHTLLDNDKAKAYGIGLVQKLRKLDTELYVGVRNYKYAKPGPVKYDNILAALLGIKIDFTGKFL